MVDHSQSDTQSSRTRSRLGCLCCRHKRKKCDGIRPQCRNCQASGDVCRWGLKVSFHPSRALELSSEHSADLLAVERERGQSGGQYRTTIVDNTDQIAREYQDPYTVVSIDPDAPGQSVAQSKVYPDSSACDHHLEAPVAADASLQLELSELVASNRNVAGIATVSGATTQNRSSVDNGRFLQDHPPSSTFDQELVQDNVSFARSSAPSCSLDQPMTHVAPPEIKDALPVSKFERSRLILAYLQETGTWCEATDSERHFTVSYVHTLMKNRPYEAAAMALASHQLGSSRHSQRQSTLSLYHHAVQSLLHYEPSQCGEATLAACVLLSVYEMMASDVSEWRHHLKGCVGNLKSKSWNGSSPGLANACFWAFARLDVWAAFVLEEETLIPTNEWVDDEDMRVTAATGTIDAYCNLAILIFAKIVNSIAKGWGQDDLSFDKTDNINALWRELQVWRDHCPKQVLSLLRIEVHKGSPFPMIVHPSSSSICGNTFYHTGSILLLRTGCVYRDETDPGMDKYNQIWHARELGGISITNVSHANWVNHLHPLYVAGQAFGDNSIGQRVMAPRVDDDECATEEEYAAEKLALLKHLSRIERETGWRTSCKAAELRRLWGFE